MLFASAAQCADPAATYEGAIRSFERQSYVESCAAFHQFAVDTSNFHHLPREADGKVAGAGTRLPDATHLAIAARSAGEHAKACSLYFISGVRWAAGSDWMMTGNAVHDAEAEYEAQHAAPASSASTLHAGRGAIPDGTYKCFTATTARLLAGGGARVVPGTLVGSLVVRGDTYQVNEHSWGHYSVGEGGKLTWRGGEYSPETLGRYVVQGGTPTIVIGWAGMDAGMACTPR